ncbi:MAG: VCBS repeat-containing protein, partial [Planctomycetales bacterium]|nr:VCBS repeat-containing protein [Planctomycetales bacterium]
KLYRLPDAIGKGLSTTHVEQVAEFGADPTILYAVAISADGNWVAAGGMDKRPNRPPGGVWVWNAQSKQVDSYRALLTKITALAFANSQNRLALGDDSGAIRLWDLDKANPQKDVVWNHNCQRIYDLQFSCNDACVVSASKDSTTLRRDLAGESSSQMYHGHNGRVYGIAVHPRTGKVASASRDGSVKLWELAPKSFITRTIVSKSLAYQGRFSADADVVVQVYTPAWLTTHDLRTGGSSQLSLSTLSEPKVGWQIGGDRIILSGRGALNSVTASASGQIMEIDCDGDDDLDRVAGFGVRGRPIWQENKQGGAFASPRLLEDVPTIQARYYCCDVNSDGVDEMLCASPYSGIWQGSERLVPSAACAVAWGDLDHDGDVDLVVPDWKELEVAWWAQLRGSDGRMHFEKRGELVSDTKSPTGVLVADFTGDNLPDVVASNWGFGNHRIWFVKNLGNGKFDLPKSVASDPFGGELLDFGDVDQDGRVDLLYASKEAVCWLPNLGNGDFGSKRNIAAIEKANWLRPLPPRVTEIYDLKTLQLQHRLLGDPNGSPGDTSLSPDGRHLALVSELEDIQIWELPSERLHHTIPFAGVAVHDVIYTSEGEYLLAAIGDDLCVWDVDDYHLVYHFQEHGNSIERVVVSPDGKLAATVSDDMSVRLWSLEAGRQWRALLGHKSPPILAAFTPDGRTVATASEDATVRVWDVETGQELLQLDDAAQLNLHGSQPVWDLKFRDEDTLAIAICQGGATPVAVVAEWRAVVGGGPAIDAK